MENITQGQWFGGPSADLGDPINQSLRFNGTQALVRTATAAVTGDWTLSFWMKLDGPKRTNTDAYLYMFGAYAPTFNLYMNNNNAGALDTIGKIHDVNGNFTLTGRYRDPAAWYHLVMKRASNVLTAWMNGHQVLSYSGSPASGMNVSNGQLFSIGDGTHTSITAGFDGYMADWHFVDGQAKNATDFGRYNDAGVWVPKTYTGTYGSQGFHLTFDSSQNANPNTGIGIDSSGNGNHFSSKGGTSNWSHFETAALSASNFDNDIDYEDTPTKNCATLNSLIKQPTNHTHYEGNLYNSDSNGSYPDPDPSTIILKGKKYWEIELISVNGSYPYVGICKAENITTNTTWYSAGGGAHYFHGAGYAGWVSNPTNTIGTTTNGDVIGIAFDRDTLQCTFTRNGGTGQTVTAPAHDGDFCAMILNAVSRTCRVNFGQRPFRYTPPTGYKGLCAANDPEPTIKNGKDHFDIITYTGDNSSGRNFGGLNFQPDFVWLKSRSISYHNRLFDVIRGINKSLVSDLSNSEFTTADSLTAFNSDGFTHGTGNSYNQSGQTYVGWCWKGGGAGVTNTDGTLTSTVSANTDAGFSIVTYVGNQSSNQTIGHGLNQAPECMFVKNRDGNFHWFIYHNGLATPENQYLKLDNSDAVAGAGGASGAWANTKPTSSVIHVGTALGNTNQTNANMVAYCWHSVPGYSKIGSYLGNANTNGQFIYLGFRPAFIMARNENTGSWNMYDTYRYPDNPNNSPSHADQSTLEASSTAYSFDFLSNGFKVRVNPGDMNTSGNRIVYMAFAENPFGGENTAPATAR